MSEKSKPLTKGHVKFRVGLGAVVSVVLGQRMWSMPDGAPFRQYWPWVSLADEVAAIRLALIVPPKLSAQRTNTISLGDCLTWLERFTSSLAKGPRAVEFYRMLAVWEGSPNRGWFGTIIIDLSEASFSPEHLKVTIQSSKPEPSSLICVRACEGVIEASHIIGRFGLAYLTESPAT